MVGVCGFRCFEIWFMVGILMLLVSTNFGFWWVFGFHGVYCSGFVWVARLVGSIVVYACCIWMC